MGDPTSTVRLLIAFALLVLLCFVAAAGLDVWQMRTELRAFTACRRAAAAIRARGARFGRAWRAARYRAACWRLYIDTTWGI